LEEVRRKKAEALRAITLASTPVEFGGTLVVKPEGEEDQKKKDDDLCTIM